MVMMMHFLCICDGYYISDTVPDLGIYPHLLAGVGSIGVGCDQYSDSVRFSVHERLGAC